MCCRGGPGDSTQERSGLDFRHHSDTHIFQSSEAAKCFWFVLSWSIAAIWALAAAALVGSGARRRAFFVVSVSSPAASLYAMQVQASDAWLGRSLSNLVRRTIEF